jgi:type I restriction enzyme S subunit
MTVVPSEQIMRTAHEIFEPMFERGLANDLESRTLATARDVLLPKLMSGEIRVKDANNVAEAPA